MVGTKEKLIDQNDVLKALNNVQTEKLSKKIQSDLMFLKVLCSDVIMKK